VSILPFHGRLAHPDLQGPSVEMELAVRCIHQVLESSVAVGVRAKIHPNVDSTQGQWDVTETQPRELQLSSSALRRSPTSPFSAFLKPLHSLSAAPCSSTLFFLCSNSAYRSLGGLRASHAHLLGGRRVLVATTWKQFLVS
jgi:hypothetical protein